MPPSRVLAREGALLRRFGPLGYRIRKLLLAGFCLLSAYVATLVAGTLGSFYPGTHAIAPRGPSETTVRGTVDDCRRTGPISDHGFGLWWVCRITVGGTAATVDRSLLGPGDVGKVVELQQACFDPPAGCRYGERTGAGWQLYFGVLRLAERAVVFVVLLAALSCLVAAAVGGRRYMALLDRWNRRMRKKAGT